MRGWLVAIRKDKNMTQAETAQAAGLSQSYYAEIETGSRGKALKVPVAMAIAKALGFDWKMFYADALEDGIRSCELTTAL